METVAAAGADRMLATRPAWKSLKDHFQRVHELHLRQLFASDPERGTRLTLEAEGIFLDYSKNRVNDESIKLLLQIPEESGLRPRIAPKFRGDKKTTTQK